MGEMSPGNMMKAVFLVPLAAVFKFSPQASDSFCRKSIECLVFLWMYIILDSLLTSDTQLALV